MRALTSKLLGAILLSVLLPSRGGRVGLFLSVCKGKQVYSENNRFSGYWSNKFRKRHCNYLFYREICVDRESLPKPLRREGMCSHNVQHKNKVQNYDYFDCWSNYSNKHVNLHANYPLSIVCPLYGKRAPLLSEGSGEAFPFRRGRGRLFIHNHKITITKSQKGFSMCKKGFLYNIIPY